MDTSTTPPFHAHWGWILLRGLLAVALGLFGFLFPNVTLAVLTLTWGAYALADGVLSLVFSSRAKRMGIPAWPSVVIGVLGVTAGILTFVWPAITAVTLLLVVATWAILVGVSEIFTAHRLRGIMKSEWGLRVAGILTLAFGALILMRPRAGAYVLAFSVASFALAVGLMLVLAALRLRDFDREAGGRLSHV